jgi:hypothetical protein
MLQRFLRILRFAVGLVMLSAVNPAHGIGHWNVPGNVAQWWGYGWGAGHHACLVLGPISHKGAFAHNHVRLPHAPQPAYGCCDGCAAHDDFGHSWMFAPAGYQPSPQVAAPSPALTPDALPIPEAAAPDAASFSAPVEP